VTIKINRRGAESSGPPLRQHEAASTSFNGALGAELVASPTLSRFFLDSPLFPHHFFLEGLASTSLPVDLTKVATPGPLFFTTHGAYGGYVVLRLLLPGFRVLLGFSSF